MRLAFILSLAASLFALPALAERQDSTPLAKASPTVAPCLSVCENDFASCESQQQVTETLCPQSRRLCIQRCDPAGLSSSTLRGLKRTPEELRNKPLPQRVSSAQR